MDLKTTMGGMTGDASQDIKTLSNYVFQLTEELRYLLNNLDVTNFNDLGLMRYENGRLQIYAEQIEIKAEELTAKFSDTLDEKMTEINASVDGVKVTVEAQGEELGELGKKVTELNVTVDGVKSTVTQQGTTIGTMQSTVTQTSKQVSAIVQGVGSNGTVTAASIVAAINRAGSSVKIAADHISLTGVVTVQDLKGEGTVEINAGNIAAGGTISGVILESPGYYQWENVSIHDGMVDFYSGYIRDGDTGFLTIYANSVVNIQTGSAIQFRMPNGRYFEFYNGALTYNESNGSIISQAYFV